jgi:hypothetical protein
MIFHSKRMYLLLPLLALSVAVSTASPAQASGTDVSLQINFGSRPHWESVRGTNVQVIRLRDRSDYDMFHYGRFYYAYNNENGRWYMSRRYSGRFALIDDRSVPRQLRRISRDHWRNYPTAWEDRGYDGSQRPGGTSSTFQVTFGSAPHWSPISGTRVEVIPYSERPDYDVFRYGGSYYVYSDNRWYMSTRESGQFTFVEDRAVPSELSTVPREHWRNYPPAWGKNGGNNGNGPGNSRGKGRQNNGRGHSG